MGEVSSTSSPRHEDVSAGTWPLALKQLVDEATTPIAIVDERSIYVEVNRAFEQLTDLPRAEHLGRPPEEVAPDVAAFVRSSVVRMKASGQGLVERASWGVNASYAIHAFPFGRAPTLYAFVLASLDGPENPESHWRRRLRFEEQFSSWSSRFLARDADTIDEAIVDTLRELGESQRFESVALVRFDGMRDRSSTTHEWSRPGFLPLLEGTGVQPIAGLGDAAEAIVAGENFWLRTAEMPESAAPLRARFEARGIGATAIFPLHIDGRVQGLVACHALAERPLDEQAWRRFRMIADLVGSAIARRDVELARRGAFEQIEALKQEIERERDYLREQIVEDTGELLGTSLAMERVRTAIRAVARTPTTVLVRGESGVGKELVARALHAASDRAIAPMIKVNCASIPRELFESEFFGHVRGAFTGAARDRVGRFELAHRGTIFLDEVGEIPLAEQAKLLRVIQEQEFERVGDDRTRKVDVRIVAATNRPLERDVAEGRFRRDLYYRLSVFPIDVPPLRDRDDDVLLLAEHFLRVHVRRAGRPPLALDAELREALRRYDFPGNVRELSNLIERAVILSFEPPLRLELPTITRASVVPAARPAGAEAPVVRDVEGLRRLETQLLRDALDASGGRVAGKGGAAERLGMNPSTLRDRLKALGIKR